MAADQVAPGEQAKRDRATALANAWQAGDVEAGAQLLVDFAPLINKATVGVWRRAWRTASVTYEDVHQNCALALLETARRWEGRNGLSFLGYLDKVYFWNAMNAHRAVTRCARLEVDHDNTEAAVIEPTAPDNPEASVLLGELWNELTDLQRRVTLLNAGVPRFGRKNSATAEIITTLGIGERAVRRIRERARLRAERWNDGS